MTLQPPIDYRPAEDTSADAPPTGHSPMAPADPTKLPPPGAPRPRYVGPDVVRALALIGVVVMNFHGYFIIDGGEHSDATIWGRFFDPWTGPLSTRFAATFVLTAGVGVSLLTNRARRRRPTNPSEIAAKRWTLVRRGLVLYAFGLAFYEIWSGSILPYYGAMFVVAAGLFLLATPWIVSIGIAAAVAGAAIEWWGTERAMGGHSTTWLYNPPGGSPRGLVFNVFVNGTHPLLPWLIFLCAGIVIGRVLVRTTRWQPIAIVLGLTLFSFATLLSDGLRDNSPLSNVLASNDPFDRGLLYTASALGTALVAFTVVYIVADRFADTRLVQLFAHAGQMSLTLYILHALVFNFVTHWHSWIQPGGLDVALTFAAGYWVVAIAAASVWHRRFGVGPAEWVYRKLGA